MKLVVGLGNPGPEYAWSRHNAGWLMLDSYVRRIGLGEPRMQFGGAFWPASIIEGERVAFLKPFTYMNLSGKSVSQAAGYFDILPSDVLVVFDDVALPFGSVRYRESGSAGGQKGMISIIASLDTMDIPRLRIGVDSPDGRMDVKDWVLGNFPNVQREQLPKVEDLAWDGFKRWLGGSAGPGFTLRADSPDAAEGAKK